MLEEGLFAGRRITIFNLRVGQLTCIWSFQTGNLEICLCTCNGKLPYTACRICQVAPSQYLVSFGFNGVGFAVCGWLTMSVTSLTPPEAYPGYTRVRAPSTSLHLTRSTL